MRIKLIFILVIPDTDICKAFRTVIQIESHCLKNRTTFITEKILHKSIYQVI